MLLQHSVIEHKHPHFCRCLHALESQAADPASKWALHIWLVQAFRTLRVEADQLLMLQELEAILCARKLTSMIPYVRSTTSKSGSLILASVSCIAESIALRSLESLAWWNAITCMLPQFLICGTSSSFCTGLHTRQYHKQVCCPSRSWWL